MESVAVYSNLYMSKFLNLKPIFEDFDIVYVFGKHQDEFCEKLIALNKVVYYTQFRSNQRSIEYAVKHAKEVILFSEMEDRFSLEAYDTSSKLSKKITVYRNSKMLKMIEGDVK